MLPYRLVSFLRVAHNFLDQRKIQQSLSPLEFAGYCWCWNLQHEVHRLVGHVWGHVIFRLVFTLAGDLTIWTGMIATERDHKEVQLGESFQEGLFCPVLGSH